MANVTSISDNDDSINQAVRKTSGLVCQIKISGSIVKKSKIELKTPKYSINRMINLISHFLGRLI